MSGQGDWLQFYQHIITNTTASTVPPPSDNHATSGMMFIDRVSDATAVSTTVAGSTGNNSGLTQLNRDGRVGKPVRRRSRASRRTPTTLLNTDTTNFRAMVQQFTGGPTPPFAAPILHPVGGASNFNLGFGGIPQSTVLQSSGYRHLHPQQRQFYHHDQSPHQFMFQTTTPVAVTHGGAGDSFLQRPSVMRPNTGASSDGFLLESSVTAQIPFGRNSTDSCNDSHGGNGSFLY